MKKFTQLLENMNAEDRRQLYLPPGGFNGIKVGTLIKIHGPGYGVASSYDEKGRSKTWEVKHINYKPDGEIESFDVEWRGPFHRMNGQTVTPEQFDAGEWEVFA